MFRVTTIEQITAKAETSREALVRAQGRIAAEAFPNSESVDRLIETAASLRVWSVLADLAEGRRQGDHADDTEAQVIRFLAEQVANQAFGYFGSRSSSAISNEFERAEHEAWIRAGRDNFGLGRGW